MKKWVGRQLQKKNVPLIDVDRKVQNDDSGEYSKLLYFSLCMVKNFFDSSIKISYERFKIIPKDSMII